MSAEHDPVDLTALAADVDRLFRARRDHRAAPLGEGFNTAAAGYRWRASPEESHAHHVLDAMDGVDVLDLREVVDERDSPRRMRTLRHVAVLGLLDPAFVSAQLTAIDCRRAELRAYYEDEVGRIVGMLPGTRGREVGVLKAYMVVQGVLPDCDRRASRAIVERAVVDLVSGRPIEPFPPPPASTTADVARTHRTLVEMSERLREWREARLLGDDAMRRQADADNDAWNAARSRALRTRRATPNCWR